MKAALRFRYGPPKKLVVKETDRPEPKRDELLIRVYATTVNRTDCAVLTGKPFVLRLFTGLFRPRFPIPGTDFAGEVEAVGDGVKYFKKGDRVWGFDDNGLSSQAEYMTISEKKAVLLIPNGISYRQAAASAEAAHYAYHFIKKVSLKPGQQVLLNGATGGIGSATLQFLRYYGIDVTAVCATDHIPLVKSLGAVRVIDYLKEDFTEDTARYDLIFDAVGKSTFFKCKKLLKENGVYLSSELGPYSQNILLALLTPIAGGKKVKFPVPLDIKASLKFIARLTEEGKFNPVIDRSYPIDHIQEAYTYVASGQKIGNVLLILSGDQK
ncbi:NAD(P)-dependent alcohol dehydrogenase [Parapedobacter sp. ISTM3]|uniref:NAD(P)-dependent alcohol dehydrogenase n=1 Tax=Parapedobacter sp. ISTM3 TaxID=2800130 RepID=UPI00190735D3|nr:NAD(P)-dependent alcohol dehydrogenase [Parapedobacter sp. ISTM3]MBK1441083.1 NAD(P)-dependent alcohol dehydrogenase [Parapedobacter sp. ISTM3]